MPSNTFPLLLFVIIFFSIAPLVSSSQKRPSIHIQNGANLPDLDNLALVTLDLASRNASNTREHILFIVKTTSDQFLKQCLTDCFDHYTDAINQVKDSVEALNSKRYLDIKNWVTSAMADVQTCEESFQSNRGYHSPLTSQNLIFQQLCGNALSIISLLEGAQTF